MKRFTLLTLFVCLMLTNSKAQVNTQDSLALVNIYNTTNGSAWTQKWTRTQPVSTWFGVTITSGRVTGLSLPNNNLTGQLLSTNIAKLTKLKVLQLQNNHIGDGLPGGIGSMPDLELLDLSSNNLSGNILASFFNNLPNLQKFNVANNSLRGWIPANISNSTALTEINISNNEFSNKIPTSINSLTNLTKFLAANNDLIGPMPGGILCDASVQVDISGNAFTFSGLECLGGNPNKVYGNQKRLQISKDSLTLKIAAGGTVTNNTYTWYKSGIATPWFQSSNSTNIQLKVTQIGYYWVVVTNKLATGLTLYSDTINIDKLGSIKTDSLALVDLYNSTGGPGWNNKSGWLTSAPLSAWYGVRMKEGRVDGLTLSNNNLAGSLPASLRELPISSVLDLSNNQLTGAIPFALGTYETETVDFSNNLFTVIQGNYRIRSTNLNLSHNKFSGPVPVQLTAAAYNIDASYNQFSGPLPLELGGHNKVKKLNLSHNLLSGRLPANLCSTDNAIEYFDLSYNKYSFDAAECLSQNTNIDTLIFSPQATLPIINNNPILKVAAGGTPRNNTYTWYNTNGEQKVASNGTDSSLFLRDAGSYWATITNNKVLGEILYTDTIAIETVLGRLTEDSLILVELYNSTNGSGWTNKTNWLTSAPVSEWFGVSVVEGRVESLHLQENNLTGQLPASFKNLSLVHELDLSKNKLTGGIPSSFISGGIAYVNLSYNLFTSLPADLRFSTIDLNLSHNQLRGPLPASLDSATGFLDLRYNNLTFSDAEGLNPEIAKIHPQKTIALINENPVLKMPAGGTPANNTYKWYKDSELVATNTGDSAFTMSSSGTYHAIVTNSQVEELTLYSDTMFYDITENLMHDSLALVDIYNNITSGLNWVLTNPVSTWEGIVLKDGRVNEFYVEQLTGTLSSSIGNLSALEYFWISSGSLTGNIPTSIANLSNLLELHIYSNDFTGSIPDDLGRNQPRLYFIEISGGGLTGVIPSGLEFATNLGELYITGTQISGTIPTFFKKLPLWNLELYGNKLTGTIPDSLSSYGWLSSLVLSHNQLTGPVPSTIRTIFVDISNNKLSGNLPDSVSKFGVWIRMSNNQFTGRIPDIRGSYSELDISNNMLDYVDAVNCGPNGTISTDRLNISNNRLNFTVLECVKSSAAVLDLVISPQQNIPIINQNPVLKAAAGGTLANNTYKWYKGAALLATNTGDSTLTITTPGLYYCIVTNSSVPGVELRTDSVSISTVSSRKMQGVNDGAANGIYNGKLSVYPNPANTGSVYIKGLQKAESVLLYNAAGQLVKQWQNVNGNQQLNISGINNGVYMLKIVEKGNQTMLKFIKE